MASKHEKWVAGRRGRRGTVVAVDDPTAVEPTRGELYARAAELDIHGRSSMSKEGLAEAIAAAES